MFGKKGGKRKAASKSGLTLLMEGASFDGELVSEGDIRIDGTVTGKVNCRATLIIGRDGRVEGEVETADMRIAGSFSGSADVSGELRLEPSANVEGDLTAAALDVEDGAKLNGRIFMKQEGATVSGPQAVPEAAQ
ncbi:hypothetical protein CHL67_11610 [Prosthecochloris sp. GSB1]|uniref:bactofilin family protein n=1 Tax=Prosthecochloris sp. GSB1 TaxID=281093 RepID=UPI000B8D162A|nr:polymer-forming cytoskeletal protein [Prosthecochloris sp. GSB1]ASQ91484.1 hypothetical protein CHL67_11610 [Prosthecochloris sp. GSB1]